MANPDEGDTPMDFWVGQLQREYGRALHTLAKVIDACPEPAWTRPFGPTVFWHEVYHNLFWLANFVGPANHRFRRTPFGADIDPRLFVDAPSAVARATIRGFLEQATRHVEQTFAALSDAQLTGPDGYDESDFDSVAQRLLYELRHLQHHNGKLITCLRIEGIDDWFW
jgi:hypothetical protein